VPVNASTPCLSLWERWLSEAKTERGQGCNTLSVTFGDSSPKGRAKGVRILTRETERIFADTLRQLFYNSSIFPAILVSSSALAKYMVS
jgi:hypothetical protein